MAPDRARERLAALRTLLGGRAAGAWQVEGACLVQIAFDPAPDLPSEVADGFTAATRSVALSFVGLGIVQAATMGRVTVSRAADLPADTGSGYWLRAFGAARSVAVPIVEEGGRVEAVVSVALGREPSDEEVAGIIRRDLGRVRSGPE